MIYLNTSQDGACEEGRLGFLLEKGEIFYSSKLSFNLIFKTSCNNLIQSKIVRLRDFFRHVEEAMENTIYDSEKSKGRSNS